MLYISIFVVQNLQVFDHVVPLIHAVMADVNVTIFVVSLIDS